LGQFRTMQTMINTTNKTNEKILEMLKLKPATFNEISEKLRLNFFAVQGSVEFLSRLGIVEKICSSNITIVKLKEGENARKR